MSDPVQILGKKLDEITEKLETMTEGVSALINAIEKTNEGLGQNVKKLTETIGKYTDTMTEHLKQDFEYSREHILDVTREISALTRQTGTDQMIRISQALNGILTLLQKSVDPNLIQTQLSEIAQFIKIYGGQK
ncbi:MAG: hypothetical protein HWN66_04955 [Candidatus Helarchaeota archaeon]|nr:hypothetical protein [Candidatus Helarchaeota archaeon]